MDLSLKKNIEIPKTCGLFCAKGKVCALETQDSVTTRTKPHLQLKDLVDKLSIP
jgi:hypothetical protein